MKSVCPVISVKALTVVKLKVVAEGSFALALLATFCDSVPSVGLSVGS